jgi:hypothetical protein
MKFVILFLPRTEIRATRATESRVSPKNMNGSRVKAISRFLSAFSPEAKCAYQNVGRRVLKQRVLPSCYFKAKMFEMFSRLAISLAV